MILVTGARGTVGRELTALRRLHGRSETALRASGIAWTVLGPNAFMQNPYGPTQGFDAWGIFRLPLGEAKYGFVDAQDIAATALATLNAAPGPWG